MFAKAKYQQSQKKSSSEAVFFISSPFLLYIDFEFHERKPSFQVSVLKNEKFLFYISSVADQTLVYWPDWRDSVVIINKNIIASSLVWLKPKVKSKKLLNRIKGQNKRKFFSKIANNWTLTIKMYSKYKFNIQDQL